jgi:hypothetical protein
MVKTCVLAALAAVTMAEEAFESIVTDMAWESDTAVAKTSNRIATLTAESNPTIGDPVGVSGIMAITEDADGNNWLECEMTGYWTAKW